MMTPSWPEKPGASAGVEDYPERPISPAGSGANGDRFIRQQLQSMRSERHEFESKIDSRMEKMENILGKVAGVQQTQLERLSRMYIAKHPAKKPEAETGGAKKAPTPASSPPARAAVEATPASPINPASVADCFSLKDLSNLTVPESDEQWKNYHGYAAWHLENEKSKKNPFDHQAYVKKGEKVTTFEDLMIVTFKTIDKIVEMKGDDKGIVSHSKMMAEKASKNLYVQEVFRHLHYENTKKQQAQSKVKDTKSARPKSDKICFRFNNESGCQAKSCSYQHRCIACERWGHAKKGCTNVDKKGEAK